MITEYFRPHDIDEALRLLKNNPKGTFPLGGGTILSQFDSENIAVVDLQLLKLDKINKTGPTISWGACVTLQSLVENEYSPQAIKDSAMREAAINMRRAGTIAGTLVSQKSISPLGAVLTAMNAQVITEPGGVSSEIKNWAEGLTTGTPSRLISAIKVHNEENAVYMDISKTPTDAPMVYSAMCMDAEGFYRWTIGFKMDTVLFLGIGKEPEELLLTAHSHYQLLNSHITYQNQIINILFERSKMAIDSGRREG
jgi:CO/xanthine dehydrogenase FAD-binding subunit